MSTNTIKARFRIAKKTESNWKSLDPVLLDGELAISIDRDSAYKVGDGISKWSSLNYAYQSSFNSLSDEYLSLNNGGHVQSSVEIDDLTAGNLIVTGSGRFTNGLYGDLIGNASSADKVDWNGVQNKPGSYTPSSHTHDDRYYTESEVDTKLNLKSNTGHTHDDRYYTESEINTKVSTLQSNIDGKQASITGAASTITSSNLTVNCALISNSSGKVAVSSVTNTELGYLSGATSSIQTQINSHTGNTSNPHSVTKAQIGLGNVENKSSATIRGEITSANVTTALGYNPKTYTDGRFTDLIGTSPENLDTIYELASAVNSNKSVIDSINAAITKKSDIGHTHDDRYYTETEIDTKLSKKSDTGHTHDDRYYTENEINTKINTLQSNIDGKLSLSLGGHVENSVEIDDLISGNLIVNGVGRFTNGLYGNLIGNASSADKVDWGGIQNKPSSYTPSSHTHDDRYYTESEIDSKLSGKSSTGHTHDDRYYTESEINTKVNALQSVIDGKLSLSGGTLTGSLAFANGTWNTVGDDVRIGDINIGGTLGIIGNNGNTAIRLVQYNTTPNTGTSTKGVSWVCTGDGVSSISGTLSGLFSGSLSGNASSASKWATARNLTIGDSTKSVDGSGNVSWSLSEIGTVSKTGGNASGTWGINISGSSASCTGNSATATTLQTTRTIFGKNFNGNADVSGQAFVYGNYSASTDQYVNSGIQIRENGLVKNTQSDIKYAPAIGFHWSGIFGRILALGSDGEFKFMNGDVASYVNVRANIFYGTFSGNASSASKLTNTTAIGSGTQPVYFTENGVPVATTYSLNATVPANAKFTDTTYTLGSFEITSSATELNYTKGVTGAIQSQLDGKALKSHTHTSVNITDATSANTANMIVKRDASGNFNAGTIVATLSGTATGANNWNVVHGNELCTSANTQSALWINHRNGYNGASSGNTAITRYYFGNRNGSTTGVTIQAESFTGNAATATTATNVSGGTVSATTGTFSSNVAIAGTVKINNKWTVSVNSSGNMEWDCI